MFSILKRNTIQLIFYTNNKDIVDLFPIKKSTNFFPNWFNDLPKYDNHPFNSPNVPNMRGCFGFMELYKTSFTMPLWSDLYYNFKNTQSDVNLEYGNNITKQRITKLSHGFFDENGLSTHSKNQYNGLIDDSWENVKIFSPWVFESSEDIDILSMDCFYHRKDLFGNFFIAPGILNSSVSSFTNINCFFNSNKENLIIPHNTPLVHLIPLTSKKIEFKIKFDPIKAEGLFNPVRLSSKFYGLKRRFLKKNQSEEKKCIFSFK